MKIQYLSTFVTVLKTGSFSAAAKELEISQGTVSNHIAALEGYLDTRIFKRTIRGVELTEAGKILKERADRIFQEIEKAKADISATKGGFHGEIKIVASTIPGEHIIPSLISEFQSKYPAVKFKIKVASSMTSLRSLEANEADFAMVGSIEGYEERLEFIEVAEEELVLIVPKNHELAKKKSVRLNEILKYAFVYREDSSGTRRETEKILSAQGISSSDVRVILELGSTESVITAVSEERGLSIISSIASRKAEAAGLIKTLRIEDAETTRQFHIARQKREHSKASETFWEFCKHFKFKNKSVIVSGPIEKVIT